VRDGPYPKAAHARRLLVPARRHDDYRKQSDKTRRRILQQLALCTYKDDDLPAERRFKRQWETTGQIASLKQSLAFYLRGHEAAGPATPVYEPTARSLPRSSPT
jgi:hypothetical protein